MNFTIWCFLITDSEMIELLSCT